MLVFQHMWPLLKAGGGTGTKRDVAVVASLSARVGSIGDNNLGGWHSYRASKAALNQCKIFFSGYELKVNEENMLFMDCLGGSPHNKIWESI